MSNNRKTVRTEEVLRIRAFLAQTGKDNEEATIAPLAKYKQLIKLLAKMKQPQDGWTMEELSLGFSKEQEPTRKNVEWIPTHRSYMRMNRIIRMARRSLIKQQAAPNYAVVADLPGLQGMHSVQMPAVQTREIERAQAKIEKLIQSATARFQELEELKKLSPKRRQKNLSDAAANGI